MKAFQNVLDAIGNTPLIRLGKISSPVSSMIFGKAVIQFLPGQRE